MTQETVSLRDHFNALRANDKEALAIALQAADKAKDKAEDAQRRVNETQNEFRGTLKDQAATLMPRAEAEGKFNSIQKQLDSIQRLVYIGLGGAIVIQIGLQFVK